MNVSPITNACASPLGSDARQHQGGKRIVDHWFVIDRHDLFTDGVSDGMQAGTRASGQDDSFHLN